MAHELDIQNGKASAVFGKNTPAWHGLGTVVEGLMTVSQALDLAGLNWTVEGMPVTVNGIQLPFPDKSLSKGAGNGNGRAARAARSNDDTWQGIVRKDTGATLGVMKGRYEVIQNVDAFNFFDSLVGHGEAVYDTAGALRGGKQVWLLAELDGKHGKLQIAGDEHKKYALLVTSHDGSYSVMVQYVAVRVVCANTLSIAMAGAKNRVSIRHTASWKDKEAEARRVMGMGEKYFATIQDALGSLTNKLLTPDQMQEFARVLLPATDEKEVPSRTQNIRNEIAGLFSKGAGNTGRHAWDALNAVTDYVDHQASTRGQSNRFESGILGNGAELKQRAYEILVRDDLDVLLAKSHTLATSSETTTQDFARLLAK